ncbi:Aldose 1-epimerase [Triticum urartu]|uniref:Aldose 1-epimerase n=1 Tax=Triticum urartu TaxID=4572 RepID=M7ZKH1_TRIUA|nr:Aldose 1-epimerase [Triticum urartu]
MVVRAALLPATLLLCLALAGSADAERTADGFYELKNKKGDFSIKVTNWGATLVSVLVPDCKGGPRGFNKVIWTVKEYVHDGDSPYITFYYRSFDGEQGFPGYLDVYVTYQLSEPYDLSIHMNATATSKATPVNLVNHAYWNLAGHGSGDVLEHELQMFASRYTPVDGYMIPTGQIAPVAGTKYDFLTPTPVGANMEIVPGGGGGDDINFAVDGQQNTMRPVARVRDPDSGRALELWANQPGVQLYTANWLSNDKGKGGKVYGQYGALCLETQAYPDAVNHPEFPSSIVRPGEVYRHDMVFKFSH